MFFGSFRVILGQGLEDLSNFGSGQGHGDFSISGRVGFRHDLNLWVRSGRVVAVKKAGGGLAESLLN